MISTALTALLAVLVQIAPNIGIPSVIVSIISALENIIPIVVKEFQDVAPMVKNIIAALKNNDSVTQDQLDQLDVLEAKLDADFEAAAGRPIPAEMED